MADTTIFAIEHIVSTPGIRSGKPRIAGRRITVGDIVISLQSGWSLEKIANEFDLTLGQIHAALSYYHDHRGEIDSQLRESDEISEATQQEQESRKP